MLVAKTLVDMGRKEVPLRPLNPTAKPQTVHKDTTVAWCEPLVEVRDTGDELLSVASCQKSNAYGCQARNTNAEVPDFLQDLLNRSSRHLGSDHRGEVADLLTEFADAFSTSDDDLGKTGIVRHRINTGGAQPIRQRPGECLYTRDRKQRQKCRGC